MEHRVSCHRRHAACWQYLASGNIPRQRNLARGARAGGAIGKHWPCRRSESCIARRLIGPWIAELRLEWAVLPLEIRRQEEELCVLMNRKSNRAPKLLLALNVRRIVEKVVSRQAAAAILVVGGAVPFVCAGFGHHVDQATRRAAEFRGETVRDHLELLH